MPYFSSTPAVFEMVKEELKKIYFNVLIKSEVLSPVSVSGERLNFRVVVEKKVITSVFLCCHSSVKKALEELPFYQKLPCSSLHCLVECTECQYSNYM